jgi:nitrogen fixation protein NifU and related proteins
MTEKHVKDLLMEHFMNPRNVGELADADGVGDVGNPLCGDIVRLFIKIEGDKIEKATFKTFGCRAAIATSSILTEMLPGKSIQTALKITEKDMLDALGDLPPLKRHCGKLAELALQGALGDYFAKSKGDSTLRQKVSERVRDPREWTGVTVLEDESASSLSPL